MDSHDDQSALGRILDDITVCISIIELGMNHAARIKGENHKFIQENHQLIFMMGKITTTNEENTNELLLTIGKLKHEAELNLRRQANESAPRGTETITEGALRGLHDRLQAKEEEVEQLQALNVGLVTEVNELKAQAEQYNSIIYHLGQQAANYHNIINGVNETILRYQSEEVRLERLASLLDQLELESQFLDDEYRQLAALREDIDTDMDEICKKEQLLEDKTNTFQHISDLRDKEIQQMKEALDKQIEAFQLSANASVEQAHLQEQREELERREAELRQRKEEVDRQTALNKQQREELERMGESLKRKGGNPDGESNRRQQKELDRREQGLNDRDKDLTRRLKELEERKLTLDRNEAEFNKRVKQFQADEADFRNRSEELGKQSKEVQDIVSMSKDVIRRKKEIEQQLNEIAEAKQVLKRMEEMNKTDEERNTKVAKELDKRKSRFEASIKAREQELENRKGLVETSEQNMNKRLERVVAKEQEIKEAKRDLESQQGELRKRQEELNGACQEFAERHHELHAREHAVAMISGLQITEVRFGPTCDAGAQTDEEDRSLHMHIVVLELAMKDFELGLERLSKACLSLPSRLRRQAKLSGGAAAIFDLQNQVAEFKWQVVQANSRIFVKDDAINRMNKQAREDEDAILAMQEEVAQREEEIAELNGKLAKLRNLERELREKTSDFNTMQEMLAVKVDELQRKDKQYTELSASFKQSEQVMTAVANRLLANDLHMKEVQVEAAMRIQEIEHLKADNEKLKQRCRRTKEKNQKLDEIIDQLIHLHGIEVAQVVPSPPASPTGAGDERASEQDLQTQIFELTLSHDSMYYELNQAIAAKDIAIVKLQAKLLKIEEEFEDMVRKNGQSMREYREYLTDKQQREVDAYMKTYNAKLSDMCDKLSDSEQNNMTLVREKLELESQRLREERHVKKLMDDLHQLNYKHALLEQEVKELRVFRDTVHQTQEGGAAKKKGNNKDSQQHLLEMAEKNIQISRLTEEQDRLKKQVATLMKTLQAEVEENQLIRENNEKLANKIRMIKNTEQLVAKGVRLQVLNLSGVDKDGNRVSADSEALDKDRTIAETAQRVELALLQPMGGNPNASRKHKQGAEKRVKQLDGAVKELQKHAALIHEVNQRIWDDDDEPCFPATAEDSSSDSSSSDSDDENPFAMGENGCVVAKPAL